MIDAKVAQCSSEEYRRHLAGQIGIVVKLVASTLYQFQLFDKAVVHAAQQRPCFVTVQSLNDFFFGTFMAVAGRIDINAVVGQMVDTFEFTVATNRPSDWGGLDVQYLFNFVQQLNRVANVAVQLVDEADDGRVTQTTDVHQSNGA